MPDLSVSDDQRERLQRVQDHLAEDVAYGHVRPRDAVEYLLDQFEDDPSADSPRPTSESAAAMGDDDTSAEDGDEDSTEDSDGESAADDARASVVSERDPTDDDSAVDEGADTEPAAGDATDETRLNSVMSLLDDHEDVWREAAGGEEKYEVDLPDGGTERARTKDDVRAVLFKHYR